MNNLLMAGIIGSTILTLLSTNIFAVKSDVSDLKAHVADEFVKKEDLETILTGMAADIREIRQVLLELKKEKQ